MTIEVVASDEIRADESTPGVVRTVVFETESTVMVRSTIEGGTTTGWHYHGDRDVYGCVIDGGAAVEYGPDGDEARELRAEEHFYIPSGTVHRVLTPVGTDIKVLVCLVGSGPAVVNVDGPRTD